MLPHAYRYLVVVLLFPAAAVAQEGSGAQVAAAATGSQTKAWVELQKNGTQAEGAARPMTGDVADAVYQRYLQSFKHPIPEEFKREAAASSGSGSSASAPGSSR